MEPAALDEHRPSGSVVATLLLSMIAIENNRKIPRNVALIGFGLSACLWLWWYFAPDDTFTILGLDLTPRAFAIFALGLGFLGLLLKPLFALRGKNVRLYRDGIAVMDVLFFSWDDIQSVSCYQRRLLPVCNITLVDGRQHRIPAFLLGDNFSLIAEYFQNEDLRTSMEPCPDRRILETAQPEPHVRKRPAIRFDAPDSPTFTRFVATLGIGVLAVLVGWLGEDIAFWARAVTLVLGVILLCTSVYFLRNWRTELRHRTADDSPSHRE